MILIDTSVLIDYLGGARNEPSAKFQNILEAGTPFGISPFTYQEVLQGAKNKKEFQTLRSYLVTQKFYPLKDAKRSYEESAWIYFQCRKHGLTLSTIDCFIAQTAVENNLRLLHRDRDFDRMAGIIDLKLF